jgi:hypothetical protein
MSYRTEERFVGGLVAEKLAELQERYTHATQCAVDEVPEAYGGIVETLVSMVGLFPEWLRRGVEEEAKRRTFTTTWNITGEVDSPEGALLYLYAALYELRGYATGTWYIRDVDAWQKQIERVFEEPVREAVSWCSAPGLSNGEQVLDGDSRSVRVYHDGRAVCSASERCYCEGNWDGSCNGL